MKITMMTRMVKMLALLCMVAPAAQAQTNAPLKTCCHSEMKVGMAISDRSIYQLGADWTTDAERTMKLGELRGKPQVVAMIYTSCIGACPLLVHEMQELAESLPSGTAANVGFLLVTFDPQRDTPTALHAYRVARQLDGKRWTLLHGRPEDVRELALVLGIKYRENTPGQFAHSNVITLLNAEGEIVYQQNGLDDSFGELSRQLHQLAKP